MPQAGPEMDCPGHRSVLTQKSTHRNILLHHACCLAAMSADFTQLDQSPMSAAQAPATRRGFRSPFRGRRRGRARLGGLSGPRGFGGLSRPGLVPGLDRLIFLDQRDRDGRAVDAVAPPVQDPGVELSHRLADLLVRAQAERPRLQPLSLAPQPERGGQHLLGGHALPAQLVPQPDLGEIRLAAGGQRLTGAGQVVEHPASFGLGDLVINPGREAVLGRFALSHPASILPGPFTAPPGPRPTIAARSVASRCPATAISAAGWRTQVRRNPSPITCSTGSAWTGSRSRACCRRWYGSERPPPLGSCWRTTGAWFTRAASGRRRQGQRRGTGTGLGGSPVVSGSPVVIRSSFQIVPVI